METSRLSLYPIKLIFVHARPPHPLIEVRRLCVRRQHTGSDADQQERILYEQLVQLVNSRKPSRNRLTKYVVKKIESIHAGHDSNTLGEHEFFQMITTADYERGERPVADMIQLRVIVDTETDEDALLTLLEDVDSSPAAVGESESAVDHGICEDDYDEYIIDRLHMEEFAISFSERQQSGAVVAALKRLPTFLAERVRGIYRKLQYGLVQDVDDQQQQQQQQQDQEQDSERDELMVEQGEQEEEESKELDDDDAVEQQVRQQDEISAEKEERDHDVLHEMEEEQQEDEKDETRSDAAGDSDSFFDSFVVVGKGGKRCLDDHASSSSSSSDDDEFVESEEAASLQSPVPEEEEEDHPYADKLKLMREMGFEDEQKNRELLAKYKGELTKVVHELMSV